MKKLFILCAFFGVVPQSQGAPQNPPTSYGILLLAHGGSSEWNRQILEIRDKLKSQTPIETALGMADPNTIQQAIDSLEARHVAKIVVVPLFINSHSEVMDQTAYVLGIRPEPSKVFLQAMENMPMEPGMPMSRHFSMTQQVKIKTPLVLSPALDDNPLVAQILLERAKKLSHNPARETVILVGHGPVDDGANQAWLKTMESLALRIKKEGHLKAVMSATIRDDSSESVKAKADDALRGLVAQGARDGGKVLIIPYLIAKGGIEQHIVGILKGMDYAWDGETICPHANIERWVTDMASQGSTQEDMRLKR